MIFYTKNSKQLAIAVSKLTSIPIGESSLVVFGDSELKPVISENVRGKDIFIISSTSNPVNESYMELFLMVDALKRSAAGRITLIMPYMGYARQNQQHMPGEPVSAHVMVTFLEAVGIDEMATIDLHEEQLTGFFKIPLTHLSAFPLLASTIGGFIQSEYKDMEKTIAVVSPDQGGVERTRRFRDELAGCLATSKNLPVQQDIVIVEKQRDLNQTHATKVVEISGSVQGKLAVIPDDVIVSGGTMVHAAAALKEQGAEKIYLCATHADFIDTTLTTLQEAPVDTILITDSIPRTDNQPPGKIHTVSVTDSIANYLQKLIREQ